MKGRLKYKEEVKLDREGSALMSIRYGFISNSIGDHQEKDFKSKREVLEVMVTGLTSCSI